MRPASEYTGRGADTRRFVDGLSGAAARSNTTPTKNTRRQSRSRSRRAPTTNATLDDLREAVTTLEDAEPIARRVFGGAHPLTSAIERDLQDARAALRAHEMSCTCVPVPLPLPITCAWPSESA